MSFGKGSSNSSQQSTSQQQLDPQIKSALLGNYANTQNIASTTPTQYTGQLVAGFNPTQQQGQQSLLGIANSGVGNDTLNSAIKTAGGVAGYAPSTVTAQSLPSVNLAQYMNPYVAQSLAPQLALLGQQNQQANMANDASATSAGAFGGDRSAVQDALTNQGYGLAAQQAIGSGYNTAYSQAQSAAQQDIANNLAAQQSNQQAGLTGAGLNLQAGTNLANMSGQQLSQATALANLTNQVGNQQQQQAQNVLTANQGQFQTNLGNTINMQQLVNQALGLLGNPVLGTAQSTGSGSSSNFNIAG